MTFRDIFKSSFLENMDSVPLLDMAIALVLSIFAGTVYLRHLQAVLRPG